MTDEELDAEIENLLVGPDADCWERKRQRKGKRYQMARVIGSIQNGVLWLR